jgi:hypothetical protein
VKEQEPRICLTCGAPFTPKYRRTPPIGYCDDCRRKARERWNQGMPRGLYKQLNEVPRPKIQEV